MDKATLDKQLYHHPGFFERLEWSSHRRRIRCLGYTESVRFLRCFGPGTRCAHCELADRRAIARPWISLDPTEKSRNPRTQFLTEHASNLRARRGHQVRALSRRSRTRRIFLAAFLRARAGRVRSQFRSESRSSANLRRRVGLDSTQDTPTGNGPESNNSV